MLSIAKIRGAIACGRKGETKTLAAHVESKGGGSLVLRIRPGARGEPSGAWFCEWRHGGQRHRMAVDRLDIAAIESPGRRDEALAHLEAVVKTFAEYSRQIREGLDPRTERERREAARREAERIANERGTVLDLFGAYVEHLRKKRKRSWPVVERALITGRYAAVQALGPDTKAAEVSPRDVQRILRAAHARGASMAAHLRSYLHSAFAFGMGDEFSYTRPRQDVSFELTSNPAAAVPRDPDAFCAGERHLSSSEVGRVWHGISDCEQQTGLALKLILAVGGQRVQEVVFARRTEFDLDARLWTLPAERVKNGREHVVPLSERACAILREALHVAGDSDFLFPKRGKPEAHMPCTSLNRAAHRIAERLGMAPWSPRDLRRTSRTWLSEAGEDDGVLDRHFNHGFGNSVGQKHYDRAQHLEEKRAVMARWDRLLALALGETPAPMPDETSAEQIGKVIPLRAAK